MKKRKRICIDINSILPLVSRGYLFGVGRTVYELVTALDKIKEDLPFDIVLYSQNTKNISSKNLGFSFESKHLSLPYRDSINRILSFFAVREHFTKADLWHCPHNSDWVGKLSKTIFTLHDMIMYACLDEYPPEIYKKAQATVLHNMLSCKAIIACSQSTKNDITKYLGVDPDKIHVIYWGINHILFKPLHDKERLKKELNQKFGLDKPYFFSVSCGYGRKNTVELIKAYNLFAEQNPTNDLVLIWNNYGSDIKELIQKNDRIHILKSIGDEDLMKLYNGATATYYPSKYEGFGLPILESMACGTPVVTCKNSSLVEIGSDMAIYSKSEDAEGLRESMENIENNRQDLQDIRSRGIAHASQFTWEKCAKETIKIYKKYLYE
ncbi:MAG: glycosyltransferase family 4 protein [Candidatus Symbiothrix sp.]|nr:glycosyltransferase family 4 protein [Candidatus Symbiothrix sp.]